MRTFLFVNLSGNWLSVAQRLKEEGEKILFWRAAKTLKGGDKTGKGIIDEDEFVEDYYEVLKKVPKSDLYILVDDNGRGDEFDFIRKAGYKVIGTGGFCDKIEYDRTYGTELMNKIGLNTPKTFSFSNIREALRFAYLIAKKHPEQRFVFKPHGEEFAGSAKTYTAKNMQDLIDYLEWTEDDMKSNKYEIDEFELQEFVDGYEIDFSAYFNGVDFMPGSVAIDIEEKKSGDGNKGQSTGCFTEDTEILTKDGWKSIKEVKQGEYVFTLNPKTKISSFRPVIQKIEQDWNEPLYHLYNRSIDILATGNHELIGYKTFPSKSKIIHRLKIEDYKKKSKFYIPRTSKWIGELPSKIKLPIYYQNKKLGLRSKRYEIKDIRNWVRFMALYLSEGSCYQKGKGKRGNFICISQKENNEVIKNVLDNTPFKWNREKFGWRTCSEQLYIYLKRFGKSNQKFIPRWIKNLPPEYLEDFLNYYTLGGGVFQKNGTRHIYTSSKKMADDLQEIFQKIGRSATIHVKDNIGKVAINGHTRHLQYIVVERLTKATNLREIKIERIEYKGKVYCVEVPNHIIYVRRNGHAYWIGNCMGNIILFVEKSKYFDKYLKRLRKLLQSVGYVGQISINNIFAKKDGMPYGLEFTPRCFPSNEEFIVRFKNNEIKRTRAEIIYRSLERGQVVEIMTPNGFSKIIDYATKKYDGKYVRFELENGAQFTVTEEHEIPTDRGVKRAIEITKEDKILFTRQNYDSDRGTFELGKFIGLYLAEGHTTFHNSGVHFTFNRSEKDLQNFVIDFGKKFGASSSIDDYKKDENWLNVSLYSKGLFALIKDFVFGNTATTKRVTGKVFEMSVEFRKGLIEGWTLGDGHKGKGEDTFVIDTASRYLAKDAQDILNGIGYEFVIHHYKNGKNSLKSNEWRWRIVYNKKRFKKSYQWSSSEKEYFVPIKKIWVNKYKKPVNVYDFKVEDERHLLTLSNGVVVHNCGWDAQLTECAIFKEAGLKLADFYTAIADKKEFPFPHNLVGCGVRVYCETPGVPKEEVIGRRFSFEEEIADNLWFYSVSKKGDNYFVEGNEVLVANAVDKKLQKAIEKVYNDVLPKVYISDIYYRMEIGKRAKDCLKFLLDNGWI